MKVIIAGPRDMDLGFEQIEAAVDASGFEITELVSGGAPGVDNAAEEWAALREIPVRRYPANWTAYGSTAGPIRNEQMAMYADALIAVNLGTRGTANMIEQARKHGLQVFEWMPERQEKA